MTGVTTRPRIWKRWYGGAGYLDRREVGELCRQMGMKVKDPRALEKLFAELDTDENGEVSFEEFDSWWKANGGRRYRESMAAVSIGGARVASSSSGEVTAADGDREQTAEQPPTKGGLMSGMGSLLQRTTSGAMSAAGAVVGKLAAKVTESSSTDTISRASARSDLIIHQAMRASPTATTPSTTTSTTPNPLLVHTDAAAEGLDEEQGGPLPLIARLGHNLPLGSATSFETEHPLAAATAAPDVRSSNGLAATTAGRLVASPGAQPFTLIFRSQVCHSLTHSATCLGPPAARRPQRWLTAACRRRGGAGRRSGSGCACTRWRQQWGG